MAHLFVRKSIETLKAEAAASGEHTLKRALGSTNLVALGIGAIIGTGIFVLTGQAAAAHAGPAIVISLVFGGIVSTLAGLCYSEIRIDRAGRRFRHTHTATLPSANLSLGLSAGT